MIRITTARRHCARQVFVLATWLALPPCGLRAQNMITRATQRVAALTAEVALARAASIDLATGGPAPVPFGAVQAGVQSVDVVNGTVVRLHLFLFNGADTETQVTLPADSAFVLLDNTGRRFSLASVRVRGPRQGSAITIPSLERATVDVVFLLNNSTAPTAVLKLGPGTVLRDIPIRKETASPPDPVAAPAPRDTTIPPA